MVQGLSGFFVVVFIGGVINVDCVIAKISLGLIRGNRSSLWNAFCRSTHIILLTVILNCMPNVFGTLLLFVILDYFTVLVEVC